MNWRQLHTLAQPHERFEAILHMLTILGTRPRRMLFVRGRLLRDRRAAQRLHFINDRRRHRANGLIWATFLFILTTVSTALSLVIWFIHPLQAALIVLLYDVFLLAIFTIKPYRRQAFSA